MNEIGYLAFGLILGILLGSFVAATILISDQPVQEIIPSTIVYEGEILGVYFSNDGQCESMVNDWIQRANLTINIMIYSFTLDNIGDTLVLEHNNGTEIKVLFEKQQVSQYEKPITESVSVVGITLQE